MLSTPPISSLVSHGEYRDRTDPRGEPGRPLRSVRAVARVGQAVNLAVERFVTVGETIADDNPEIKTDMYDACKEARTAGSAIEKLCEAAMGDSPAGSPADRGAVVRAARCLLQAVTRVLLLADIVVVKQLLLAKDKVARSLGRLENVSNFTEFVKAFSQFGAEMVELAYLTGDRQNDTKDERRRAQMAAARQVLDRSTVMLLVSSKTCLRHPSCPTARESRDTVFCQMRRAMDLIHYVVKDGVLDSAAQLAHITSQNAAQSPGLVYRDPELGWLTHRLSVLSRVGRGAGADLVREYRAWWRFFTSSLPRSAAATLAAAWAISEDFKCTQEDWDASRTAYGALKHLEDMVEMTRITLIGPGCRERMTTGLDTILERVQDFTDSAYTTHEHRENILLITDRAKIQLSQLLRVGISMDQVEGTSPTEEMEVAMLGLLQAIRDMRVQLVRTVVDQTAELQATTKTGLEIVDSVRNHAMAADTERIDELAERFHEVLDHILEVCKMLRHIACTDTLQVNTRYAEINLRIYGPQVVTAAHTLAMHPQSKIAREHMEVFSDMWQALMTDVSAACREVIEVSQARGMDKHVYMSLPRPGKHGTTTKPLKAVRLDSEEQAKIAKAGLDMKLASSEMEAEADKWRESEENNDIVKRAKNMSSMAFSMYQFTRGEGALKTTQDLFTQAEYFAEEANRLYKVVRQFSYQVPSSSHKKELLEHLDRVPTYVQQLQFTVKNSTVGKAATFTKVDNVIHETKNLMNVISKVVTTCFVCATKYNLDFRGLSAHGSSGSPYREDEGVGSGAGGEGKGGGSGGSDPSM
ncbi:hypothetical protein ONE63_009141 [Megalurothrips usitatus]|uniref:Alpha-catulin n=1 Tax=Megalurothrips usitatus TaxID=439358 RepID=A0AAV7XJM3_9NEOP|nr:hypothetical protein ONE63_009141 [Megalurothrips usitatus]